MPALTSTLPQAHSVVVMLMVLMIALPPRQVHPPMALLRFHPMDSGLIPSTTRSQTLINSMMGRV